MKDDSLSLALMALLGATVFAAACGAGYWWVAHQMAWWTFALTYAACTIIGAVFKGALKAVARR
jgi:ABC-type phosphate transport system auxiliary subunit